jgi:hypothetical protein
MRTKLGVFACEEPLLPSELRPGAEIQKLLTTASFLVGELHAKATSRYVHK